MITAVSRIQCQCDSPSIADVEPDDARKPAFVQDEIVECAPLLRVSTLRDPSRARQAPCALQRRSHRSQAICSAASKSSLPQVVRNPSRPRFTPRIGTVSPSSSRAPRRSVPSPPKCYESVDLHSVVETFADLRDFVQALLEAKLDAERGRDTKEHPQYLRQLIVSLMPDDTDPHQPARRRVPRGHLHAGATLARVRNARRIEADAGELSRARRLLDEVIRHSMRHDSHRWIESPDDR